MVILALEYNIYEILAVAAVFVGGLFWWFAARSKWGLLLLAGAAVYGWFYLIQPLLSAAPR